MLLGQQCSKCLQVDVSQDASEIFNNGFPLYELQERKISENTSACIVKAMSPKKKDRYQTVDDFLCEHVGQKLHPSIKRNGQMRMLLSLK